MNVIDPCSLTISSDTDNVRLTRIQFALFDSLFRAKGRGLTYSYLQCVMEEITGKDADMRNLRVQICKLAQRLAPQGFLIKCIYGVGYQMPKMNYQTLVDVENEVAA